MRVCVGHWHEALARSSGAICGISLIDCPQCSRPDCTRDAIRHVTGLGGEQVPVCSIHYDDLSWIEVRLPLLSDEAGWSDG